jgi:hypothetical protein
LEAGDAEPGEASSPERDGVVLAAEFGSDSEVGGAVGVGGAEDDAGAAGECLRGGVGAQKCLQVATLVVGQGDGVSMGHWHGCLAGRITGESPLANRTPLQQQYFPGSYETLY